MCGICGYTHLTSRAIPDEGVLRAMAATLRHRGPDEDGVFVDAGVGLANTRLSIIDLAGGHQPFANEDGSIQVVFNGEIYNHQALREELVRAGHRFISRCDTEVLVHLYEEEGEAFVQRLNGMFAIALWDGPRGRMLLARDRLGIKPLFHAPAGQAVVFASEIKALLAFPGVQAEPDPTGLDQYLALRYTPGRATLFRGIHKLPPGSLLIIDARAATVREWAYWEPWKAPPPPAAGVGDGEVAEEVRHLLDDAVRLRLMSDVPFGAFLSGGLDSSGVVALMARHLQGPVQTFSIGFSEEPRLDEGEHARAVARHCGTHHREVDCTADRVELLPKLLYHFDEPFADPIIVPTHQVSELARQHVKVVLTGEGADELFGGYTRFVLDARVRRLARLPGWLRRTLDSAASRVAAARPLARALALADLPAARRALAWVETFGARERRDLYADPGAVTDAAERLYDDTAAAAPGDHPLEQLLFCELRLRLPECMLARTDRMTMAVSLEGRTPFLDHRLVERVLWLPHQHKVRGCSEKHVLKKALAPLLPAATPRRRKQGLAVPFAQWTRHGIEAPIRRILSPERVRRRGLFRPGCVSQLLERWGPHEGQHSQRIWSLLCLELWFRMYIDTGAERLDPATPLSQVP